MEPKTITFTRTRKINPALISPKYQYGSEEISFGAWMDVPEDSDQYESSLSLIAYVESIIQDRIETMVIDLRSKARNKHYFMPAIYAAFTMLLETQNLSKEEIEIAFEQFEKLLETEMSKLEV